MTKTHYLHTAEKGDRSDLQGKDRELLEKICILEK